MDPTHALLRDLVATNSVNPSLVAGASGEAAIARRLVAECQALGLTVEVQEAAPGRPNVVATLEGRAPGRSLMFCGHIDTVGVEGMAAPFDPVIRDGRLYGRGAQDMKAGVAAMIGAARVVVESGGLVSGRLVLACVVDEEHSSIGADALVTRWRADAAVVTEPTDLAIAVAHKGFEWVRVEVTGTAAHGSRPDDGVDAIMRIGRVLRALERLDRRLQAGPRHPLLGPASLHASLIGGGRELSSYPDHCTLDIERRTIPGEAEGVALAEVQRIVARLARADASFRGTCHSLFARSPYEIASSDALPAHLTAAGRDTGLSPSVTGMSFWTDAAILGGAGIPSVLFGPTGAGLHGLDEWVDLASVLQCRDTLAGLVRRWCV